MAVPARSGATPLVRRQGPRGGVGKRIALGGAALVVAALSVPSAILTFVGNGLQGSPAQLGRDEAAVARSAISKYSIVPKRRSYVKPDHQDRAGQLERRKRARLALREGPPVRQNTTANYDKLPPMEDLYDRKFTGDAAVDPVGGRRKYTFTIMFKHPLDEPTDPTTVVERRTGAKKEESMLNTIINSYAVWLSKKMSCKNFEVKTMRSPIDGNKITQLEYPMKEYGILDRRSSKLRGSAGTPRKKAYSQCIMVQFKMTAPPSAIHYITQKFYQDQNIIRFMYLRQSKHWWHEGEDNELFL